MLSKPKILVVDDEEHVRKVLSVMLKRAGYEVATAEDAESAVNKVDSTIFDVVLCDIRLPKSNGFEILKKVKEISPDTSVIMITAYATVETAVEAMKEGAFHYISKPFKKDELLLIVEKALERKRLIDENRYFRQEMGERYDFSNIIGKSKAVKDILETIKIMADTDCTVLIVGKSGTGKELIAKAIHYNSGRRDRPLITVNCGSVPPHLLESEFFGHIKGAFTGAVANRKGLFEEAHGSTLFLDEVGELTLEMQVSILRAIQEKEIKRVGSNELIKVDIRIIAATSKDLEKEVEKGKFREELYYRLNVVPIYIPPLRERQEDIPLLIMHFLAKYTKQHSKETKIISPEALNLMMEYDWRGNVRELENVIERAVVMARGDILTLDHLSLPLRSREVGIRVNIPVEKIRMKDTLDEVTRLTEKDLIGRALEIARKNRTRASELLGINRRTLLYKMKEYGLKEAEDLD